MPKVEFKSNSKPSTFAYPPNLEEKKDKAKEKVETAVLSITAKQKKKEADKKKEEEKMEVVCSRKNCFFHTQWALPSRNFRATDRCKEMSSYTKGV